MKTLTELDQYLYRGHSVIIGLMNHEWQDKKYVLRWFGRTEKEAVKQYREFVKAGINEGKRPDLVGGGLIRTMGGWSEVISMRRRSERKLSDERILGNGSFVERILEEADEPVKRQMRSEEEKKKIAEIIQNICKKKGVKIQEVKAGGRRIDVSHARAEIALTLVRDYGISFSEVARNVGVTTSGI